MRGGCDPDMGRPDFLEPIIDKAIGQVRAIAVAAKMTQVDLMEPGRSDLLRDIASSGIRKVPVPAQNPLFDRPGTAGVLLQ